MNFKRQMNTILGRVGDGGVGEWVQNVLNIYCTSDMHNSAWQSKQNGAAVVFDDYHEKITSLNLQNIHF